MRHAKSRYQLNRFTSWRKATLISLVKSLLIYQRIKTTKIKARAVKPWIDRLISLAKDNNLSARRQAYKILGNHRLVSLLFNDIAPRFKENLGGFTRILNLRARRGDNAQMALLELTVIKKTEKKKPKKEKEVKPVEEKKPQVSPELPEKPPVAQKPSKKFFGGLRKIFKKERDSL
ncbi:MAG: 50S ribosomal protein L17 [Omnitrophica WOR_2 bacterium RIFCSPLOWO2_01_FULL_41_12]|nr:MAG: 50S ribosomal protein L17 [Omnitrophica WOR_2 bacterium RIFCSPLOWO2_01_FULL_41_12]